MTAAPLNNSLAKVRKLLPVKLYDARATDDTIYIMDKHGEVFCAVTGERKTMLARAELIRDAMNEME